MTTFQEKDWPVIMIPDELNDPVAFVEAIVALDSCRDELELTSDTMGVAVRDTT